MALGRSWPFRKNMSISVSLLGGSFAHSCGLSHASGEKVSGESEMIPASARTRLINGTVCSSKVMKVLVGCGCKANSDGMQSRRKTETAGVATKVAAIRTAVKLARSNLSMMLRGASNCESDANPPYRKDNRVSVMGVKRSRSFSDGKKLNRQPRDKSDCPNKNIWRPEYNSTNNK